MKIKQLNNPSELKKVYKRKSRLLVWCHKANKMILTYKSGKANITLKEALELESKAIITVMEIQCINDIIIDVQKFNN